MKPVLAASRRDCSTPPCPRFRFRRRDPMVALDTADVYTVHPQFEGAMYASAILFGAFAVAHYRQERRR